MIALRELLADLYARDVRLWLDGEQLRFRAPKGVLTPELLHTLKARKSEIIGFLQQAGAGEYEGAVDAPSVPRGSASEGAPLSYAQQRLWYLDQLGGGAAYNMSGRLLLHGRINLQALRLALASLVERHAILRTTYTLRDGQPRQLVHEPAALPLNPIDLRRHPPDLQQGELDRIVAAERARPFNLSTDPMIRATLISQADQAHCLLLILHHIACDAWSLNIALKEILALYSAFAQGLPCPLAPLRMQYADYATWQRSRDLTAHIAYFQSQLRQPLPILDLPFDNLPPATDHRGGSVERTLAPPLTAALRGLARQGESTPFMVLLGGLYLLLSRVTGQDDLVIGAPSVGRSGLDAERMIGLFLDTLALRMRLSGVATFRELLGRVRTMVLDAFEHQDAPFDQLVRALNPERLPGRDPIFEVMLNFLNESGVLPSAHDLAVSLPRDRDVDALRALTLYVHESPDSLKLQLVYQRALFSTERMSVLMEQYVHLLEQAVRDADRPLASYSLVTPRAAELLPDLRRPLPASSQQPITASIAAWAKRTPRAPAIRWRGRTYSYGDLMSRALQRAHALRAQGVRTGDVVAVQGPRSFGTVASLLGVLLAGGTMLPVAPSLPNDRREAMLSVGRARVVLAVADAEAQDSEDPRRPLSSGRPTRSVDAAQGTISDESEETANLDELPPVADTDPAYVMFTSGTTGVPKGILGTHRGLAHFLAWQREEFAVGPGDRCGQVVGLSFDVMLRDIFLALTSGATLCIADEDLPLDGPRFLTWLNEEQITLLHPVPSLAHAWLQHAMPSYACASLRWSFFAGEPLPAALLRRWRQHFPMTKVANLYGPSETTMAKCCYVVPDPHMPGVQPIGTPLPGCQALILRDDGAQCGIGEPGQIVLRTPYRTLGYLNPDRGAQRFIQNPQADDPQDLFYFTGDRGRRRPDGNLEILGRVDDEVKIRGVRVQPAEVSSVLNQHAQVAASAVIHVEHGGERRLIAYVVPARGEAPAPSPAELRQHLSQRLPAALVPSAFVLLTELPVTSNGKLNREALPAPDTEQLETLVVPRNDIERRLVQLWQEVLGLRAIGIRDSFFALGGHSLLAVHLMVRIKAEFGQELTPNALLSSPTIEGLAAQLQQPESTGPWSPLVPMQEQGSRPPFFCLPGLGGNVLYLHRLARQLGPDQPFYALQAVGLDGASAPHESVEAMARCYCAAIRSRQPVGPYFLGGHSFGGQVAFEMAQQLLSAGQEVALLALLDAGPPDRDPHDRPQVLDEATALSEMAAILGFMSGRTMDLDPAPLRMLSSDQRMARFRQTMEAAGLLPRNTDHGYIRGWLAVFLSNYRSAYHPRPAHRIRPVYFAAAEQPAAVREKRIQGWLRFTELDVRETPGSHLTMMAEPHIAALARSLQELLTAIAAASKGERT